MTRQRQAYRDRRPDTNNARDSRPDRGDLPSVFLMFPSWDACRITGFRTIQVLHRSLVEILEQTPPTPPHPDIFCLHYFRGLTDARTDNGFSFCFLYRPVWRDPAIHAVLWQQEKPSCFLETQTYGRPSVMSGSVPTLPPVSRCWYFCWELQHTEFTRAVFADPVARDVAPSRCPAVPWTLWGSLRTRSANTVLREHRSSPRPETVTLLLSEASNICVSFDVSSFLW